MVRGELIEEALNAEDVLNRPMEDNLMRDFAPAFADAPLRFRYTAAGQGGSHEDADHVQSDMIELLYEAEVSLVEVPLLSGGGSVVHDSEGRAGVSTTLLADNDMGEENARAALQADAGVEVLVFIDND